MKFPTSPRTVRIFLLSLACLLSLAGANALAHEPFDISSRMIVYENRIELTSILGTDSVRQLLAGAGRSQEEIANCLKARGPDAIVEHPATLAQRFFQLKGDGVPLSAKRVTSLSEGMEIILTLTYPRPVAGNLEMRAVCYETIPGLGKGLMTVEDETAGPLGAALLSPTKMRLTVPLPAIEPKKMSASSPGSGIAN